MIRVCTFFVTAVGTKVGLEQSKRILTINFFTFKDLWDVQSEKGKDKMSGTVEITFFPFRPFIP